VCLGVFLAVLGIARMDVCTQVPARELCDQARVARKCRKNQHKET